MINDYRQALCYPLDHAFIARHRRKMEKAFSEQAQLPINVAVLGGSSTQEVCKYLKLFLSAAGFKPTLWEGDYNRYFEEGAFDNPELAAFAPDIIYLHTSARNLTDWPSLQEPNSAGDDYVDAVVHRFEQLWASLGAKYKATVVQNNFELPAQRPLGQLEASHPLGRIALTERINQRFARHAQLNDGFLLHDLNYLSARFGLDRWYDDLQWYAYKFAMHSDAFIDIAHSVTQQIRAVRGLSKKLVICDLDNTLWGGIVGDDGVENLQVGAGSPQGEAHEALQRYLKTLSERGVVLAVCSKNEEENARSGFDHHNSVLKTTDFASFIANWLHKPQNIEQIMTELNLGMEAAVFLDDNPTERELVRTTLPAVAVPEIGSDASHYLNHLDKNGFFEVVSLNKDDTERAKMYADNQQRSKAQSQFQDYGEYLASLNMTAIIKPFDEANLPRIAQLTNKTNQFNLTTIRYSEQQIRSAMEDDSSITLFGRLEDKFGDNGLVSVLMGNREGETLTINLWLMSCRVFKRDLEWAMFKVLLAEAQHVGIKRLVGRFIPSAKNGLVKGLYAQLGFTALPDDGDAQCWQLALDGFTLERDIPIRINP